MKTIEETQEVCSLCGGRGVEVNYQPAMTAAIQQTTCRQCQGSGFRTVKRVLRYEEIEREKNEE